MFLNRKHKYFLRETFGMSVAGVYHGDKLKERNINHDDNSNRKCLTKSKSVNVSKLRYLSTLRELVSSSIT